MKLNKKGFTLIELLAVIVILAVIALIAVPQVIQILNKARKSAAEDSAYGIIKAAESYVATYMMDHQGEWDSDGITFNCTKDGCKSDDDDNVTLDFKGTKPSAGKVILGSDGVAKLDDAGLTINGFTCTEDTNEKIKCDSAKASTSTTSTTE